jgi:LDH2 family malate/lactate/ureidoglycolate dehydrogenase
MNRVAPAEARRLAEGALVRWGASPAVAACVAHHVVDAELAGHPSHGLRQLPRYRELSLRGQCDLRAAPTILDQRAASTLIDGGRGLGHPALALAVDSAARAAHELGVGVAGVVNCGHAGRAGAWAERGLARGAVTIVALGGSEPPFPMVARAGAAPAMHTNPLAISVPARGEPLLLDMATSVVAEGKVRLALAHGSMLPPGAIVASDGQPSTSPSDYDAGGSLLPAGGYKGFGLSALIEALAVSLTGADAPGRSPVDGALVICLKENVFRTESDLRTSAEALRSRIRGSGREAEVLAPGDPEARARRAGHIAVDDETLEALREDAADLAEKG